MLTSRSQKGSSPAFEERSAAAGRVGNNARQRITMPEGREEANPSQRGLHGDRSRKYLSQADCSVYSIRKGMSPPGPFYRDIASPSKGSSSSEPDELVRPAEPLGVTTSGVNRTGCGWSSGNSARATSLAIHATAWPARAKTPSPTTWVSRWGIEPVFRNGSPAGRFSGFHLAALTILYSRGQGR
jgi:hypothetical protein